METLIQTESSNIIMDMIIVYFNLLYIVLIFSKLTNKMKNLLENNKFKVLVWLAVFTALYTLIRQLTSIFYGVIFQILLLSILLSYLNKNSMGYCILVTMVSLSINYIIYFFATMLSFLPNALFKITNNVIGMCIILVVYTLLVILFLKTKRIKNGVAFLQKNAQDEYFDMLILNISVIIIFCIIMITNYKVDISLRVSIGFVIAAIIMFITIQKSLQLYYKQKQLIKTLEETQAELEKYKKDVKDLEEENLNISKKSHSLVHKQKQLEYKLNELLSQTETTITEKEKEELNSRIENISKELYTEKAIIELTKTDIPNIDDMLKYQQSECIKNKIDFDLQISGNIHHMINTLISKEDLEILIADHVKDAIIAINHSNNENRSILVRLGKIDECYGIYIYDTGIEFEKETLESLGKKPSTTHANEDGTGMGFMNTFDTLRKCKASLIIKEIGKPSKDNFTKVIMIKFNNKQEFRVESYRNINIEVKLDQDSNNENNSKSKVTIK